MANTASGRRALRVGCLCIAVVVLAAVVMPVAVFASTGYDNTVFYDAGWYELPDVADFSGRAGSVDFGTPFETPDGKTWSKIGIGTLSTGTKYVQYVSVDSGSPVTVYSGGWVYEDYNYIRCSAGTTVAGSDTSILAWFGDVVYLGTNNPVGHFVMTLHLPDFVYYTDDGQNNSVGGTTTQSYRVSYYTADVFDWIFVDEVTNYITWALRITININSSLASTVTLEYEIYADGAISDTIQTVTKTYTMTTAPLYWSYRSSSAFADIPLVSETAGTDGSMTQIYYISDRWHWQKGTSYNIDLWVGRPDFVYYDDGDVVTDQELIDRLNYADWIAQFDLDYSVTSYAYVLRRLSDLWMVSLLIPIVGGFILWRKIAND